jgi:predicted CopG family antitoxin
MAIKTISLELDAYEKLKRAKRGKESFSAVVRRARFDAEENTGELILNELEGIYKKGRALSRNTTEYWDRMETEDKENPRISPSAWDV